MTSIFDSPDFNDNLFFPRNDIEPIPKNCKDIFINVEKDINVHVRKHINNNANCSLLFFHGNGEIVSDFDDLADIFRELNVELIICDYRGYGQSNGKPTLKNALQDCGIILNKLKMNNELKKKICILGRSLGSAPAIELASNHECVDACIIESGYQDPVLLARRRGLYIQKLTEKENSLYNNGLKIKNVSCPLLILHGASDNLIFPEEARINYKNATTSEKKLVILNSVGHNDIFYNSKNLYIAAVKEFLNKYIS